MTRTLVAGVLLAAAGATRAPTLSAQQLDDVVKFYFAVGAGAGHIEPTCDTDCRGDRLGANALVGYVGYALSSRIRVEVGAQRSQSTDDGDGTTGGYYASAYSAGLAVNLTRGLFVRGGVLTGLTLEVPDAVENPLHGQDSPGYSAGAGYDFHFFRDRWAVTPYVNVYGGSIDRLEYDDGSGSIIQTAGSARSWHAGLFLTFRHAPPR